MFRRIIKRLIFGSRTYEKLAVRTDCCEWNNKHGTNAGDVKGAVES